MTFGRQLRYVLVGPIIGSTTAAALWPTIAYRDHPLIELMALFPFILLSLPAAYLMGALPAFLVGQLDEIFYVRKVGLLYRFVLCNCLALVLVLGLWKLPFAPVQNIAFWIKVLLAVIPTSICCVWTNRAFDR